MFTKKYILGMHFSIKNLGIVQSAEIELNGLTVLTGYNDCGKSFIGKVIFAVIKTIQNAPFSYIASKVDEIVSLMIKIEQVHRRYLAYNFERSQKFQKLSRNFTSNITGYIHPESKLPSNPLDYLNEYENAIKDDFRDNISEISDKEAVPSMVTTIETYFSYIRTALETNDDMKVKYEAYFNKVIIPELFQDQINSLNIDEPLEITITEGATLLLKIVIENNSVSKFDYQNPIFQTDATIIETPTVLLLDRYLTPSILNISRYENPSGLRRELPFHYSDLMLKLNSRLKQNQNLFSNISKEISNLIGGM